MNIQINKWLENLLKEPCFLDDDKTTFFDVWFHTQILGAVSGYNRE